MTDREALLQHINDKAVVVGEVTLSSGRTADYYVDLRRITLDGAAAPLVGPVMLDLTADLDFDAVGGLTLGADPVAAAMLHAAAARGRTLDAFVVRKEGKAHGLQRRIEGPSVKGRRVLAVEDTSTTGGSVLTAVEALREEGAEVVAVAVIVDRDTGSRQNVEAAGVPYRYAYGITDIVVPDVRVGSVVLLHSPLVTAATWGDFPAELRERGLTVHVVDVVADTQPPYAARYVASVAQQLLAAAPAAPLVLVGHSGAGPLLPAVGRAQRAAGRALGGYVFLDAGLPRSGASRLDLLGDEDTEMAATFRAELEAGVEFPSWAEADLEPELPDPTARATLVSGLRPRRLDFFTEPLPTESSPGADDWPDAPCAYLRTSAAYEHWARVAGLRGWDVETLSPDDLVGHFAALRDPAGLATALVALLPVA